MTGAFDEGIKKRAVSHEPNPETIHIPAPKRRPLIAIARFRPGIYAGISLAISLISDEVKKSKDFDFVDFPVGRRNESDGFLAKAFFQAADIFRFAKLNFGRRIDAVHLNTVMAKGALPRDILLTILAKTFGVRIFLELHGSNQNLLTSRNFFVRTMCTTILRNADVIGVLSSEELHSLSHHLNGQKKIVVVKNPTRRPEARPNTTLRSTLHIPSNVRLLLFASRLDESKGVLDVISALSLLKAQGSRVVLIIAGDGEERSRVQRMISDLGLMEDVRFLGWVPEEDTSGLFRESDVLVFPSYYYQEGFPMVVLHACTAGLPIITTRYRAMADYLREPENCLFVEPRNPKSIADRVQHLLADATLMNRMGENNTRLAAEFTPDKVAEEFVTIYKRLMSGANA